MRIWKSKVVYFVFFLYISDCLSVVLMLSMDSRHVYLIKVKINAEKLNEEKNTNLYKYFFFKKVQV